MQRTQIKEAAPEISTQTPVQLHSNAHLNMGSWHIENNGEELTENKIELLTKSVALQIIDEKLDGLFLQIPQGISPKVLFDKIEAHFKTLAPHETFFYQMEKKDKTQNLILLAKNKFDTPPEIKNEIPAELITKLPEDFLCLFAINKQSKKPQIFINAGLKQLDPEEYEFLYALISDFVAKYPDYEVMLEGNARGQKDAIVCETNGTVSYFASLNAQSANKKDFVFFRNAKADVTDQTDHFKPTMIASLNYNYAEQIEKKYAEHAKAKNKKENKLETIMKKAEYDPLLNPPKEEINDKVIKASGNDHAFFKNKKESKQDKEVSLTAGQPDINYFSESMLVKINEVLDETNLAFSEQTKNATDKRDVINKANGQLQFSIYEKKFTTKSEDETNFENMLLLFQKVHGDKTEPLITAPNNKIKLRWQKACQAFGYPETCVKLRGEKPQDRPSARISP